MKKRVSNYCSVVFLLCIPVSFIFRAFQKKRFCTTHSFQTKGMCKCSFLLQIKNINYLKRKLKHRMTNKSHLFSHLFLTATSSSASALCRKWRDSLCEPATHKAHPHKAVTRKVLQVEKGVYNFSTVLGSICSVTVPQQSISVLAGDVLVFWVFLERW